MQLRQCFSRAKPFRLKKKTEKARFFLTFFDFQKSQKRSKKVRISKSGFKKAKLATLLRCITCQDVYVQQLHAAKRQLP